MVNPRDIQLLRQYDRDPPAPRSRPCKRDDWIVREKIGSGAFGVVKNLCCGSDCDYVEKSCVTERELAVNLIASLYNVVPTVYGHWFSGKDSNCIHLVSERMKQTLEDPPEGKADIPLIFNTLIMKLETLHSLMVTHGDIKADNIMLSGDGTPYYVDLGLASIHPKADAQYERQCTEDVKRLALVAQRYSEHFTDDDFDLGLEKYNYREFYLMFS